MITNTLLVEIGTEELPPKALNTLSMAFKHSMEKEFQGKKLSFHSIDVFATPRRLALIINDLESHQDDYAIERRGPAVAAAMKNGAPTPALLGFARSCGVEVNQLEIQETDKGAWYTLTQAIKGESLATLLPEMIEKSLKTLPIPKRMRWGNNDFDFVRPIRWITALYGTEIINMELFGIHASNTTNGHRFHTQSPIVIDHAKNYESILEKEAFVIPHFEKRKESIAKQITDITQSIGKAIVSDELLNEVTALVEWPVALVGSFETHFLNVPQEALIIAMEGHQRYFPIVDNNNQLMNKFCFISNLQSSDPNAVIDGNERVIRPRFSDAQFFWEEDKKVNLNNYLESLESVIFQTQLGTQADKIRRVTILADKIAEAITANHEIVARAARLNKSDLISNMVQEFPELQGTMARYYAQNQGEEKLVADSLEQVYWPRFAGDKLPESKEAQALGLAERIDTIVGIFAIGEIPTGSRDPYSLRRNALAILRIIIENKHNLNLLTVITESAKLMPKEIKAEESIESIFKYIFDRMRAYTSDLGVPNDTFESIAQLNLTNPLDIYERLLAVTEFKKLPEAEKLIEAYKRIHTILERNGYVHTDISEALFENNSERALFNLTNDLFRKIQKLQNNNDYTSILLTLANLAIPLDQFFEMTKVMDDNLDIRNNRLALLTSIHNFFIRVADISKLQL